MTRFDLDPWSDERKLLDRSVARARAHEQQRLAVELRAQIEQERQAMQAQFDQTRERIMAEWAELRCKLDAAEAELARLKMLHSDERHRRTEEWRSRMLVAASLAQFDPSSTMLQ